MSALWRLTITEPEGPGRVKLYRSFEGAEDAAKFYAHTPGTLMSLESVTPYSPNSSREVREQAVEVRLTRPDGAFWVQVISEGQEFMDDVGNHIRVRVIP